MGTRLPGSQRSITLPGSGINTLIALATQHVACQMNFAMKIPLGALA